MHAIRIWAVVLMGVLAGLACGSSPEPTSVEASAPEDEPSRVDLERARLAAGSMGSRLMGTLVGELKAGGPVQAVKVCAEVAPAIAAEQSTEDLTIRRVTLRPRNPAAEADPYERAVLEAWDVAHAGGESPEESSELVIENGRKRLRYMRPILVMTPCLSCHGDPATMSPELRTLLAERYPDDRATGYRDGDLRGAFSVTVDLAR